MVNAFTTVSAMADILSVLKVTPMKIDEGAITLRSESTGAGKQLKKIGIPYPGRIREPVPT